MLFDFQKLEISHPITSVHPRAMIRDIDGLENRIIIEMEQNSGVAIKLLRQGAKAVLTGDGRVMLSADWVEDTLLVLPGAGATSDRQDWAQERVQIRRLWRADTPASIAEASWRMIQLMKSITAPANVTCENGTFAQLSEAMQALADFAQRHVRLFLGATTEEARVDCIWPAHFSDLAEIILRTSKPMGDRPDFAHLPAFKRSPSEFKWTPCLGMDSGHDRLSAGGALRSYFHHGPGTESGRAHLEGFLATVGL